MAGAATIDWIYEVGGWTLAGVGGVLLLWALFWDCSRGRRRCPKCWYDMAGLPGLTCPECGRDARREKRLLKTRRRWQWIPAAFTLAASGYIASLTPTIRDHGWRRAIPSGILVWIAPMGDGAWKWTPCDFMHLPPFGRPTDPLLVELLARAHTRVLRPWQCQVLFDRVYRAHPEQIEYLVRTRDLWPRGVPVACAPLGVLMFMKEDDIVLRVRIRNSDRPWAECAFGMPNGREILIIGPPPEGEASFVIEGELLDRAAVTRDGVRVVGVDSSSARLIWRGTVRTVRVVAAAQELMKPVNEPGDDSAVVQGLEPRLCMTSGEQLGVRLSNWGASAHFGSTTEDWALGLQVEVLHYGEREGMGEVLCPMMEQGGTATCLITYSDIRMAWTGAEPTREDLKSGSWIIRLTGDPRVSLRDIWRTSYWAGTVEVPAH